MLHRSAGACCCWCFWCFCMNTTLPTSHHLHSGCMIAVCQTCCYQTCCITLLSSQAAGRPPSVLLPNLLHYPTVISGSRPPPFSAPRAQPVARPGARLFRCSARLHCGLPQPW
jgi:hypothetical protein